MNDLMNEDTVNLVFGSRSAVGDMVQGEMDLFVDIGPGGVGYAGHGAEDELDCLDAGEYELWICEYMSNKRDMSSLIRLWIWVWRVGELLLTVEGRFRGCITIRKKPYKHPLTLRKG